MGSCECPGCCLVTKLGVDFLKQHKLVLDLATSPETISTGSTKKRNPPKVEENGYEPVVFLVVLESERQAKMNVYHMPLSARGKLQPSSTRPGLAWRSIMSISYNIAFSLHVTNCKVTAHPNSGTHCKLITALISSARSMPS